MLEVDNVIDRKQATGWGAIIALLLFVTVPGVNVWVSTQVKEADRLATVGVIVAVATFVLVAFQIVLQRFEVMLVEQQGKVLTNQEYEMNRKADMLMYAEVFQMTATPATGLNAIQLAILNFGTRTADSCTIVLLVPVQAPRPEDTLFLEQPIVQLDEQHGGSWYSRYEFDVKRLFFVDHTVLLPQSLRFGPANNAANSQILYQLIYADSSTPSHYSYLPLRADKAMAFGDIQRLQEERASHLAAGNAR